MRGKEKNMRFRLRLRQSFYREKFKNLHISEAPAPAVKMMLLRLCSTGISFIPHLSKSSCSGERSL
jgi:hypothetical protein